MIGRILREWDCKNREITADDYVLDGICSVEYCGGEENLVAQELARKRPIGVLIEKTAGQIH